MLNFELLTMQTYIDRDNLDKIENVKSEKLLLRQMQIMKKVEFDRKMRDFKLRRKIWRKFILSLFMKIRHLNKCADLTKCFHQMFDLNVSFINRVIDFVESYLIKVSFSFATR
jgi:hypothetical protein